MNFAAFKTYWVTYGRLSVPALTFTVSENMCYNLSMSPAEILKDKPSEKHFDVSDGEGCMAMILAVVVHIVIVALGLLFLRLLALLPS